MMNRMKNGKILSSLFIVFAFVLIAFNITVAAYFAPAGIVKAEAVEETLADGCYGVKATNDMPMGKSNISEEATLEKNGNLCYLTLTFKRTAIDNPELKIDGKNVGQVISDDGDKSLSVTYTLSYANVFTPLSLSVYVVPNAYIRTDKTGRQHLIIEQKFCDFSVSEHLFIHLDFIIEAFNLTVPEFSAKGDKGINSVIKARRTLPDCQNRAERLMF